MSNSSVPAGLKRRLFPKGIRRKLSNYRSRLLKRTNEKTFTELIAGLQIESGSVVCVHSMLSAFGYLPGGPQSVIRAIQRAVPRCTIIMPTFPFSGTALAYIQSGIMYDPTTTGSQSGLLTDTFWKLPGVRRSLHPTHPCAALGPLADELIDRSEHCSTPFGDDSTYGRFSKMSNAVILCLHTNGTSMVHRFQEIVGMPNLFMPGSYLAKGYNDKRETVSYSVRIHTPNLPLYAALPGESSEDYEYVWLPDFSFLFPSQRKLNLLATLKSPRAKEILLRRQQEFVDKGQIRSATFRAAEIAAVVVAPWQERLCADLTESIRAYPGAYQYDTLSKAHADGRLY